MLVNHVCFGSDRQRKGLVDMDFDESVLFFFFFGEDNASPDRVWSPVCADKGAVLTLLG